MHTVFDVQVVQANIYLVQFVQTADPVSIKGDVHKHFPELKVLPDPERHVAQLLLEAAVQFSQL